MGTSRSSSGPASGVPLIPPWVPPLTPPDDQPDDGDQPPEPSSPVLPSPIALPNRFGAARTNLGTFARGGGVGAMRRALGYYVARGYGGSQTAALRMGGTARTAGRLYETLTREGVAPESLVDLVVGEGASADEVIDSIVEAVRPMDGSQDAEASRLSIKDAFVELLDRFPSADLLHLSEEERFFAVERFLALDVFARFELDLGRTLQQRAPTALVALSRRREVRDYIKETVSASLRELRAVGTQMNARRISELALQALQRTFEVFEEYVQ